MAIVLPIECKEYLPHESRVSIEVQKKYAAQITGLAAYRGFFTDSAAAYAALETEFTKVGSFSELEDALDLSIARKSLDTVRDDLTKVAVVEKTDAECSTMIATATLTKGTLEVV